MAAPMPDVPPYRRVSSCLLPEVEVERSDRNHDDFGVHLPLSLIPCAAKVPLEQRDSRDA